MLSEKEILQAVSNGVELAIRSLYHESSCDTASNKERN